MVAMGFSTSRLPEGERIVMAPWTQYPLPEGRLLLIRQRTNARLIVSERAFQLLTCCDTMCTLDEHAATAATTLPYLLKGETDLWDEIEQLLQPLLDCRLMVRGWTVLCSVAVNNPPRQDVR